MPSVSPARAGPVMDVQEDSLCGPGQTLVFCLRILQGGLLVATEELLLKSRCCGSVRLTCPTISWSCVSLENPQPLEQALHGYRKTASCKSICTASHLPSGSVCEHPGVQLVMPVKITFTPCIDQFTPLHPIFSSLSLFLGLQFCFSDRSPLIKPARSWFKVSPIDQMSSLVSLALQVVKPWRPC